MADPKKTSEPETDPYEVLDLPFSASDADITKSYRKLALRYHPDKQNGDQLSEQQLGQVAQKFQEIQEARDFLLDAVKRRKYDTKRVSLEARKAADRAREQQMSAKRRRMKEQLTRQEKDANRKPHEHSRESDVSSSSTASKKRNHVEELRRQGKKMRETYATNQQQAATKIHENQQPVEGSSSLQDRQIRLKWSRKRMKISPSEHDISKLMEQFGTVEQVEMLGSKANMALVTFHEASSCTPCVEAYLDSEEMRASYVGPRKEEEERMKIQKEQRTHLQQYNRATAQKDHESVGDYKLRHAAEREKILRQLEEQSDNNESNDVWETSRSSKGIPKVSSSSEMHKPFPPQFPSDTEYQKCQSPHDKLLLAEERILSALLSPVSNT